MLIRDILKRFLSYDSKKSELWFDRVSFFRFWTTSKDFFEHADTVITAFGKFEINSQIFSNDADILKFAVLFLFMNLQSLTFLIFNSSRELNYLLTCKMKYQAMAKTFFLS